MLTSACLTVGILQRLTTQHICVTHCHICKEHLYYVVVDPPHLVLVYLFVIHDVITSPGI